MNRMIRDTLTWQLREGLLAEMALAQRTAELLTGRTVESINLVERLEADLHRQISRLDHQTSAFDIKELNARMEIAKLVVRDIRLTVETKNWRSGRS